MALISVTRLRIRSAWFLLPFFWYTLRSHAQAKRAKGNLQVSILNDADRAFWTLTAWEDLAAMRAYMVAGAHMKAMPKLMHWCDEASVGHWTQDSPDLPSWAEAHRRMVAEGRLSKVYHPSAEQQAGRIRAPR